MRAWTSSRSKQNASMLLHELSLDWPLVATLIGVVGTILEASGRSWAVVALGLGVTAMAGANLWQPVRASRDFPAGHGGGPRDGEADRDQLSAESRVRSRSRSVADSGVRKLSSQVSRTAAARSRS